MDAATNRGEDLGLKGEKEGMIIDMEGQWQTVGDEGAGKKIQLSRQRLARARPRLGHDAA